MITARPPRMPMEASRSVEASWFKARTMPDRMSTAQPIRTRYTSRLSRHGISWGSAGVERADADRDPVGVPALPVVVAAVHLAVVGAFHHHLQPGRGQPGGRGGPGFAAQVLRAQGGPVAVVVGPVVPHVPVLKAGDQVEAGRAGFGGDVQGV